MDKLRAIRFFCRVVEAKSFAAAAHDLDIAPSVLSKVIAALEADLKFRLLNRTTRRLSLTESGASYYDRCKRLVVELDEAEVITRDGVARPSGRLLAGLHPAINRLVMSRINEFIQAYPDIVVETTLISNASTLIEDKLDVLVAAGDLPDSNYAIEKLGTSKAILVAAPSYLAKHGAPKTPGDLPNHAVALSGRRDGPSHARWSMSRGSQTEIVFVHGRVVNREGVHMHEACLSGAGISRLLEISARAALQRGDLVQLLPDWSLGTIPINAVFPARKNVPAKARLFVRFAKEVVRSR